MLLDQLPGLRGRVRCQRVDARPVRVVAEFFVDVDACGVTVHDGHVDVHDNGLEVVWLVGRDYLGRLQTVLRSLNYEVHLQLVLIPAEQERVVVNDKDSVLES
jgi:hypothetical protein